MSATDQQREARLRAAGKTNRADAERELEDLRRDLARPVGEPVSKAQLRLRSSVRIVNRKWVSVSLQVRLADGMPWLDVLNEDHPVLISRTSSQQQEDQTDYINAVIKRFLVIDAGLRAYWDARWEVRTGSQGVTEYRTWLNLEARAGVAVRTRPDGMLNIYGLS